MKYKLSENENYHTMESQKCIMNELPKMEELIELEIVKC